MSDTGSLEQLVREYKAILEHAEIAVIFTRNRLVYRCNRHAEALFGWPEGELPGKPGRVFYPSDEAYAAIGREVTPILASGRTVNSEFVFARYDGSSFLGQVMARAVEPGNPEAGTVWIVNDISESRRAAEASQRLLREQQLIFQRAQTGILFSRDRRVLRCNPRFEEIFGFAPGELVGQSARVYYPNDDLWRETGRRVYAAIAETGVFSGELLLCRRDGTPIWCNVTGSPLDPERPEEGHVWLYEDITARRAAEEALRQSNREYSLIFDNAMIGISYMRARRFLRCNRRLEEIFGFAPGALLGQSARVLFASDSDFEEMGHRIYGAASADSVYSDEIAYRRQDGKPIWVRVMGRQIIDDDQPIWIWTYQDVTRRHLAEEALRQNHRELEQRVEARTAELSQQLHFLQQMIEAIPGPVFYTDANARYLGCNSAFSSIVGLPPEQLIGKTSHDIAPGKLGERTLAADRKLLETPGSHLICETPVHYPSGDQREVMLHQASFTRPDGSLGGLVGVMLDITERKRLEHRLQQAATVFDSSAEGVTINAADGSIIAVNRAFSEITGYSEEEVVGRNPRLLQSGRQDAEFYRQMWTAIETTGRWQGEIWNRRKDGGVYPEWLTISAVRDKSGQIANYVGVFSDITAIKKAHEELDFQAHHDPLTGLPNRLLLEDRLLVALQRARRESNGVAVLFIDLDRFKNINDTLGHHIGDRVLCQVGTRFGALIRESDTVARLGGDEFIIVIGDVEAPAAASRIADKILDDLRRTPITVDQEFFVGASIGISVFPQDGEDSAALMKNADIAMYRAKERGRNTYEFFTKDLTQFSLDRFRMETGLRRAIERGELRVFLQPQFSLKTGSLVGAEALVRWQHPELGLIPPAQFIPLAEESGLIVPLGEWVQQTACRIWAEWFAAGLEPGILSINVSGIEFRRGRIKDTVRRALADSGLPPELLELEITESAIMSQAENSIQLLHDLRAMGLSLAIDDFGTGYSSLAYLKQLPLIKLKVDQSFIRDLPADTEDAAITRAVIALAHCLQLTVIAEGVETEDQRSFLSDEGCDEMQGFLRGRPVPTEEFRRRFLDRRREEAARSGLHCRAEARIH